MQTLYLCTIILLTLQSIQAIPSSRSPNRLSLSDEESTTKFLKVFTLFSMHKSGNLITNTKSAQQSQSDLQQARERVRALYVNGDTAQASFDESYNQTPKKSDQGVSQAEFQTIVTKEYEKLKATAPTQEEIRALYTGADTDQDNLITKDVAFNTFRQALFQSMEKMDDQLLNQQIDSVLKLQYASLESLQSGKDQINDIKGTSWFTGIGLSLYFSMIDRNSDGYLDESEFEAAIRSGLDLFGYSVPAELSFQIIFNSLDLNKDGFINEDDLESGITRIEDLILAKIDENIKNRFGGQTNTGFLQVS